MPASEDEWLEELLGFRQDGSRPASPPILAAASPTSEGATTTHSVIQRRLSRCYDYSFSYPQKVE